MIIVVAAGAERENAKTSTATRQSAIIDFLVFIVYYLRDTRAFIIDKL